MKSSQILVASAVCAGAVGAAALYFQLREKGQAIAGDIISLRGTKSFLLPSGQVAYLFSHEREKLASIEAATDTEIRFDEFDPARRKCLISGCTLGIIEAEKQLRVLIREYPIDETLTIPREMVRYIKGKNGTTIKSLKADTGLNKLDFHGTTSETLNLRGRKRDVNMAKRKINELMQALKGEKSSLGRGAEESLPNPTVPEMPTCHENSLGVPTEQRPIFTIDHRRSSGMLWESLDSGGADGSFEIYVTSLSELGPSQFWVQLAGTPSIQLDKLMSDMWTFYGEQNCHPAEIDELLPGALVAVKVPQDERFYRAVVMKPPTHEAHDKVGVFFADIGGSEDVEIRRVLPLNLCHAELRFQAIECSLAGISACDKQTVDAFERFSHVGRVKPLSLIKIGMKTNGANPPLFKESYKTPEVALIDRSDSWKGPVNILDVLLDGSH